MKDVSKFAPDDDQGQHAYVVERSEWGRTSTRVVYAASLAEAKRQHGWTRQRFVYLSVRRARAADVPASNEPDA